MKKCDNCIGSGAIKKYADSDFLDISIIEDAAKKITGNTAMIRTSLLSVSDIFIYSKRGFFQVVIQILMIFGLIAGF